MIRNWIATALLAGSWLFGLGYYQPASVAVWFGLLTAAVLLLGDVPVPQLSCKRTILAVVLLLPSAWLVSFPSKAIPLLLAGGLVLTSASLPRRWPRWLGQGAVAGAAILLGQSLVLEGYAMLTARAHELPAALVHLLAAVPRALGVETALDGSWLVLRSLEQAQRVGATWDLLLDAASVCSAPPPPAKNFWHADAVNLANTTQPGSNWKAQQQSRWHQGLHGSCSPKRQSRMTPRCIRATGSGLCRGCGGLKPRPLPVQLDHLAHNRQAR